MLEREIIYHCAPYAAGIGAPRKYNHVRKIIDKNYGRCIIQSMIFIERMPSYEVLKSQSMDNIYLG